MPSVAQQQGNHPTYATDLDFSSVDPFNSKFNMSHIRESDMDFYSFDNASPDNHGYDMALSPMPGTDMFFSDNARPMHIDPAATWQGSARANMSAHVDMAATQKAPDLAKILTDYDGSASRMFGQITPPSESDHGGLPKPVGQRADSCIGRDLAIDYSPIANVSSRSSSKSQSKQRTMSSEGRAPKRARRDSEASDDEDANMECGEGDNKREKYREKNRVAAAKCRAKKKGHVDQLEDTHRTQSALNTALKQTEKSLRDELSFWRTQALQHTFCSCRPVQEYNMRKAQSLATESLLGNHFTARSPSIKSSSSAASPVTMPHGANCSRSQSVSNAGLASPSTTPIGIENMHMANFATFEPMARTKDRHAHESMRTQPLSNTAEQDLKNFVNDVIG